MTAVERLAIASVDLATQALSPEVIHHAKRAVVDWASALLPGAVEQPANMLEAALREDMDRGTSRLAMGRRSTTRAAALINGTAAHTVEVDDIYREAIYHPGAPTIAAALAVAQEVGGSGLEFLRSVVVGYEVSTRIGATLGRAHYRYWHNTGTVGTFGAAAAAGAVYGLNHLQMAHALATAATFAAGLQQAFRMDSMSKPLHAGRAAEGGVLAAQAARSGMTGSLDVLDGDAGMGVAMGGHPDWSTISDSIGSDFHIQRMTFKNHACCGHTFAAIDAAQQLLADLKVRVDDLARVRIRTYGAALEVAGHPNPVTAAQARFSLPYVVAHALLRGSVRLAAFEPERLADPAVRNLMRRIELQLDPELDAAFPGRRAAVVEFTTHDGRTAHFHQPTRKGDPELPLSDQDLNHKFIELAAPVVGMSAAHDMLSKLWGLEEATDLSKLLA